MAVELTCPNGHIFKIEVKDDDHPSTCPICESTIEYSPETTCSWELGEVGQKKETTVRDRFEPGQRLGRFELLSILGQGGFGVVYRAYDPQLDRQVALKSPRRGMLDGEQEVLRFLREARAAAQLRHPHIAPVYDAGEIEGRYYIAGGLINGKNLRQHRAAGAMLNDREVARLVADIAEALHYAHKQGIVHRDVKPENIMIDEAGEPHVMDFGLARREEGDVLLTREGMLMGTPAYMSPEQASGNSHLADARSDIWSVGIILYESLTGRLPFSGDTIALLQAVVGEEPTEPRRIRSSIPKDLETICLKCIAKDAAARYPSALHVADELERWLRNEPIQARPIGFAERTWRAVRRNPIVASLGALLFATLLVGVCVSAYYAIVANHRADELLNKQDLLTAKTVEAMEAAKKSAASEIFAKQQELFANRRAYSRSVAASANAWNEGHSERALRMLASLETEADQVDLRGFEWRYLWGRVHNQRGMLAGHRGIVFDAAFFSDAQRLATTGEDGTLRIWDVRSGREMICVDAHYGEACDVAVTPNGQQIVSAGADGLVKVWNAETAELIRVLRGHRGTVSSLAISPDGRLLASGSYQTNVLGELFLWDLETGARVRELKGHKPGVQRHPWGVASLAFSPDGKQLASASYDGRLYLFDVQAGDLEADLKGHTGWLRSVAYSPDGQTVATGSDDATIRMWDANEGRFIEALSPGVGVIQALEFSPDGRVLTIGSLHGALNYDLNSKASRGLGHAGQVLAVTYSSDGSQVAMCGRDELGRVWDANTQNQEAIELPSAQWSRQAMFSPDGQWFAVGNNDSEVTIWDSQTLEEVTQLKVDGGGSCRTVSVSPSGDLVAAGDSRGRAAVWRVDGWSRLWQAEHHAGEVTAVAFSPDGSHLVTAGSDGVIRFCDPATGDVSFVLQESPKQVRDVAFCPASDRLAVAYANSAENTAPNEVAIWDWSLREQVASLDGHLGRVNTLAYSPDGRRLASGDFRGGIRLWDVEEQKEVALLRGHSGDIYSVTFSPDGQTLASSSSDTTVKLWSVATGDELVTLSAGGSRGHYVSSPTHVCFSPNARQLVACCGDPLNFGKPGSVLIWSAPDLVSTDRQLTEHRQRILREETWATYTGLRELAGHYEAEENYSEAIDLRRKALVPIENLCSTFPDDLSYFEELASMRNNLGISLNESDRLGEAIEEYKQAMSVHSGLYEIRPGPRPLSGLGGAMHNLGIVLRRLGKTDESRHQFLDAVASQKEALQLQPHHIGARKFLASHHMMLALLANDAEQWSETESHRRKAADIYGQLTRELPAVVEFIDMSARVRMDLAGLLIKTDQQEKALVLLHDIVDDQLIAVRLQPLQHGPKQTLRGAYIQLAEQLSGSGQIEALRDLANTVQKDRSDVYQAEYDAATLLARCLPLIDQKTSLSEEERQIQKDATAKTIIDLLRPSIDRRALPLSLIDETQEFDVLKSLPSFQKLVQPLRKQPN